MVNHCLNDPDRAAARSLIPYHLFFPSSIRSCRMASSIPSPSGLVATVLPLDFMECSDSNAKLVWGFASLTSSLFPKSILFSTRPDLENVVSGVGGSGVLMLLELWYYGSLEHALFLTVLRLSI